MKWGGLLLAFLIISSSLPVALAEGPTCDPACEEGYYCSDTNVCSPEIVCGDGSCDSTESCESCPSDCGECPPVCGDGECVVGSEDCASCPSDCLPEGKVCCEGTPVEGDCCEDSDCSDGYVCESNVCTEINVEPECGNGICEDGETCDNCSADCGECPVTECGNGICEDGETCDNCSADCGECPVTECGNGICEEGETNENCQQDCYDPEGSYCGDGVCDEGESCDWCSQDCGPCDVAPGPPEEYIEECGNSICGDDENCENCPSDCGSCAFDEDSWRNELLAKVSTSYTDDEKALGKSVLEAVNNVYRAIKDFGSDRSPSTAYTLAYAQRLNQGMLRGLIQSKGSSTIMGACRYASLNGPGTINIWNNEFDEVIIGGLDIYNVGGLRANLYCNEHDFEAWLNIHVEFDRGSRDSFKDDIKQGWSDAEQEARELEVAGQLAEFLKDFTISDDNRVIGEEVIGLVDSLAESAASAELSEDSIYGFEYDSILKSAEIEGLTNTLSCADFSEVSPYVMIYSSGTPDVWENEFGELTVNNWKQLFEGDLLRVNIHGWCDDFRDQGSLNINTEWGADVRKDRSFVDLLKKARDAAWKEAELLKRKGMVIEARKLYNFTLEQEEIGNFIIEKLEVFKEKIVEFEANPTTEGAYELEYDSVLLSAEIEGYAQAYGSDAEMIGIYVMLYGPGFPDVWVDEFGDVSVGGHLSVHRGDNLEYGFNQWFDDYSGRGGFNSWLNFGRLRREYSDEIKRAEREAWIVADQLRRKALASKMRGLLEEEGVEASEIVSALKDYVTLFNKYLINETTAFELELKRLQVSDLMKDINESLKDYIMVSDLGDDVPPTDIWLEWDSSEIMIGGWRELIIFNKSLEQPFTGLNGWCDWHRTGECGVEINIDWVEWKAVRKELDRANELFWRQKREAELADELAVIIETKSDYSSDDQGIEAELVTLMNGLKTFGEGYTDDAELLQYDLLVQQDVINDALYEADNKRIIRVAVADTPGFHEFDEWAGEVRGVVVYSGNDIEIIIRFNEIFRPFFLEGEEAELYDAASVEYEVFIDVVWKEWTYELGESIARAYERYEKEQSIVRFNKLVEKRNDIVPSDLKELIDTKVQAYEAGSISMSELKNYVNGYYYKIMGYDNELAYLASLSGNEFPVFDLVNIVINTENVKLELYERDFSYRFGGEVRVDNDFFTPGEQIMDREIEIRGPELVMRKGFEEKHVEDGDGRVFVETDNGAIITSKVLPVIEGGERVVVEERTVRVDKENWVGAEDTLPEKELYDEAVTVNIEEFEEWEAKGQGDIEQWDDDLLMEIEGDKVMIMRDKEEMFGRIQEGQMDVFEMRKVAIKRKGVAGERLIINGVKPRLKFSVEMTSEEVRRLAAEIKVKWEELMDSGIIYDMVYNINNDLDNFPSLQDAVREWGDVTTSIRLKYQNESVFEITFETKDGYISWVEYGIVKDAGIEPNTVFIELDFESLMRLKNNWERGLKNAEGPFDVIASIPGMFGNVVGMFMSGEIVIQPFGTVFRLPNLLKIFFEVITEASGLKL